jgi:hypothetical protein
MSMSMPTLPTTSFTLMAEPTTSEWHDFSQWVDASVQQQHHLHHQQMPQQQTVAFDDSFLSTFLSADMLQADEVALLDDLLR